MNELFYDTIVIGSGPAGATTARMAAEKGLRVLLIDKRQELGAPVQCSGAISRHALIDTGIEPEAEYIHEAIYGFAIYNEKGEKTTIDYRQLAPEKYGVAEDLQPLGYVVDRRRFDRRLMTLAERAGAEVWLKTEALGYEVLPEGSCILKVRHFNQEIELRTKVVVGADGLQSIVGKWAGLRTQIRLTELAGCLQYVVDRVQTEGLLEIITGHEWAPGGYAWVFPKGFGYAEIGLGVIATMTDRNAQQQLEHFIQHSFLKDRFQNARILEVQGGGVPLAAPLKTQYADNMILVGDAARHVNPITGGGIHTALAGGKIAADFLAETLPAHQGFPASLMKKYQDNWLKAMGQKMWKLYDIKTEIFKTDDIDRRNQMLYETMSGYFSPGSEYKKI